MGTTIVDRVTAYEVGESRGLYGVICAGPTPSHCPCDGGSGAQVQKHHYQGGLRVEWSQREGWMGPWGKLTRV